MVRTAPAVREGVRSRRRYLTTTVPDAGHAHPGQRAGPAGRSGDRGAPAGALRIDEEAAETYTLDGSKTPFLVFYRSPRLYFKENGPPAAGAMRSRPLCHWDLHAAYSPEDAGREVCLKVGNAALALAGESGGIALDVLGFIINSADDLLPRSR